MMLEDLNQLYLLLPVLGSLTVAILIAFFLLRHLNEKLHIEAPSLMMQQYSAERRGVKRDPNVSPPIGLGDEVPSLSESEALIDYADPMQIMVPLRYTIKRRMAFTPYADLLVGAGSAVQLFPDLLEFPYPSQQRPTITRASEKLTDRERRVLRQMREELPKTATPE